MSKLINPEDYGLEEVKANELTVGLKVVQSERNLLIAEFDIVSKLEITEENLPKFKKLRLKLVKNRTQGIDKWHKANKEFFLIGGKFVDAIKHKESHINQEMEQRLASAEQHFKNLEVKRLQELQTKRAKLLLPYSEFAAEMDLSSMQQDVFDSYLATKKQNLIDAEAAAKKAKEEQAAKDKAAKIEQDRLAEENRKIRAEYEKKAAIRHERSKELQPYLHYINDIEKALSADQTTYDKGLAIMKDKAEMDAKLDIIRKAKEAKIRAQREAEEQKQAVIYRENLEAQKRAEAERAQEIANHKKIQEAAAKLAEAPIREQMIDWVNSFELPECKVVSPSYEKLHKEEIETRFVSFKNWAKGLINQMNENGRI